MAKVFIEETTLTAIGDAIREKEGTAELVPVVDMATRISAIESGGGSIEPVTFSGNCGHWFQDGQWDWFAEVYKGKIITKDISVLDHAFRNTKLKTIPFDINLKDCGSFDYTFCDSSELEECPRIRGTLEVRGAVNSINFCNLLTACHKLRDIEDLFEPSMLDGFVEYKPGSTSTNPNTKNILNGCYSLRRLPSWFYKLKLNPQAGAVSTTYCLYSNLCVSNYALDEARDIPIWSGAAAVTSNMFGNGSGCLSKCSRLKAFTFETDDNNQPLVANWKSQAIHLTSYVGYVQDTTNITSYNSGITPAKRVTDAASYQTLKNDPDWWTTDLNYSRYNLLSAIETINSLPDTTAAAGTNNIKFKNGSGSKTDGGGITADTMVEASAIAAAKGWTVAIS